MEPLDTLNRWTGYLRDRHRLGTFFRYLWDRFMGDNLFQAAGALSYTTVFALVPLFVVGFGVLSAFPVFDLWRDRLVDYIFSNFVPSSARAVEAYLRQFSANAGQLTAAGIVALVVSLLITLNSVEVTFNRIWRVPTARPKFARFLVYWTVFTLGALVAATSLALSSRFFAMAMFETEAGALARTSARARHAVRHRAAGLRHRVQGRSASHRVVAACVRGRVPRGGVVRRREVVARRVHRQLQQLREGVRHARVPADLPGVDLPGVDVDPARRVVRRVDVLVPLPAGVDAPAGRATRCTACCACSAASTTRARTARACTARRSSVLEPVLTDSMVQEMLGAVVRDRPAQPRRKRRVVARARPRRPHARRTLRSLPTAHSRRRSPRAHARRRARPARVPCARRAAAPAARPAEEEGVLDL